MALSNAERQRRWRQKQRENNYQKYLKKERTRKKDKYIPTHLLSEEKKAERRKKCREDFKKHYIRKKKKLRVSEPSTSRKNTRESNTSTSNLKVRFPFQQNARGIALNKRYRRALRKAYRDIYELQDKCVELQKGKKTLQKRLERERLRATPSGSSIKVIDGTPRSKTKLMLKKVGLKVDKRSDIHKRLVFGNAVLEAMKATAGNKKSVKNYTIKVGSQILKKYRCIRQVSTDIGLSRNRLSRLHLPRNSRTLKEKYGKQVRVFLEREDNSTVLPGKRDVTVINKVQTQKHILNDYLHNLHQKFCLENPTTKLSRSSFSKLRPTHILLTRFSSRRTCLCTYHQNFALKIKTMKKEGLQSSSYPDVFIKEIQSQDVFKEKLLQVIENSDVKYRIWKKVLDGEKLRWKEVEEVVTKERFIEIVVEKYDKFSMHVSRVKNQYSELRKLRENLPEKEVLVWMDFAENYSCSSVEEVQSAYWNAQMVSLHTMVVYFPQKHSKTVQSYVGVSSLLSHNATVVYTILRKLIPMLKQEYPEVECVHYLTDSPSSQYRNKTIFQILCEHENDFGIKGRWNYLETGHGKGSCDGLGARVKRMADMDVKQQKCLIQDGTDFYDWAQSKKGESRVKFIKYTEEEVEESSKILKNKHPVMAVPGTMKLHAAVPLSSSTIAIRQLSCYCPQCLHDVSKSSCGWEIKSMYSVKKTSFDNIEQEEDDTKQKHTHKGLEVKQGDWVSAIYDCKWYVGVITDVDENECQVNFLTKAGKYRNAFKFPQQKDEIWVNKEDILVVLHEVQETGKARKIYRLSASEEKVVESSYQAFMDRNTM